MRKILLSVFAVIVSLSVFSQNDNIYIHSGQSIYEFPVNDVDSITFYRPQDFVSVTGVTLNETSAVMNVDESITLTATVLPTNANYQAVAWGSSNIAVATVDHQGVVTAISTGTTRILAITHEGNFAAACTVSVGTQGQPMPGDGPYVIYNGDGTVTVVAFDSDLEMYTSTYPHRDDVGVLTVWSQEGDYSFSFTLQDEITPPQARYNVPEQIVHVSDPHGDIVPLIMFLQGNGVIDEQLNWSFGTNHLMIPGDVMDRGEDQTAIYWLLYKLEKQARQAGGEMHFLIGNHEVMVAQSNLSYAAAKYLTVATKIGVAYDYLWSNNTELGRWMQSRNTIEIIGSDLYVHGGLGANMASKSVSIEQINDTVRKYIALPSGASSGSPVAALIMGSNGPFWYRGLVDNLLYESDVDEILARYEVSRMIMGHTRVNDVSSNYNGKVICLDISNVRMYNLTNGKSLGANTIPTDIWPVNVNGNAVPFVNVTPPPPPPPPIITPDNVATYEQDPAVQSYQEFLHGGTATYKITYMSPTLEGWLESYQSQFPEFEEYTIIMPRGDYQLSLTANYESGARWYMGPNSGIWQGIFPMSGAGNNPLSDVTFVIPRNSYTGTPPTGYNTGAGALSFKAFVQNTTGFIILQDGKRFWFRSKANPNEWFCCEGQY